MHQSRSCRQFWVENVILDHMKGSQAVVESHGELLTSSDVASNPSATELAFEPHMDISGDQNEYRCI